MLPLGGGIKSWLSIQIMIWSLTLLRSAMEPESMVIDVNGMLWVLCNGGWKRDHFAELIGINTYNNTIEKRFTFPVITDSPTCLQINRQGETLYYLYEWCKTHEHECNRFAIRNFHSKNGL